MFLHSTRAAATANEATPDDAHFIEFYRSKTVLL